MFLTRLTQGAALLGVASACWASGTAWQLQTDLQMGLDAWHIEHKPNAPGRNEQAFMPDSQTQWKYRDVSPWYTIESRLRAENHGEFVLRGQANASRGAKLNQLSYDHFISPSLGLRAGVLDYRATWCRTYDIDNPWVREADPFCSNSIVSLPTDSAPALQIYTNLDVKGYVVQAMVGSYHPLAFNYAPEEFSDFILPPTAKVTHNHKIAASINALDPYTSTEWRLSWIGVRQSLHDPAAEVVPGSPAPINYHHKVNLWFAGVSWQVTPKLRSRLTYMNSQLTGRCEWLVQLPIPECVQKYQQESVVAELNYNVNSRNVVSLALTQYPVEQVNEVPAQGSVFKSTHQSLSVGWRKDWSANMFTVLQLTHAHYNRPYRRYALPGDDGLQKGNATAIGFRWGYKL